MATVVLWLLLFVCWFLLFRCLFGFVGLNGLVSNVAVSFMFTCAPSGVAATVDLMLCLRLCLVCLVLDVVMWFLGLQVLLVCDGFGFVLGDLAIVCLLVWRFWRFCFGL